MANNFLSDYFSMRKDVGTQVSDPQRGFDGPQNLELQTSSSKLHTRKGSQQEASYKYWSLKA